MMEAYKDVAVNEDTLHGRFLTFKLDNDVFAIEIGVVTEIIGIQPITGIPEVPSYIKGIINLRGKIIPVMDMRIKFQKPSVVYDGLTCIIVIDILHVSVGLIVDNVSEVISIQDEDIVPPPELSTGAGNGYVKGIGKVEGEIKLVLDCQNLLSIKETANLLDAV